jgi:hypothetical protein
MSKHSHRPRYPRHAADGGTAGICGSVAQSEGGGGAAPAAEPRGVILQSLQPGNVEALKVKPDGRIMNGNTRVKVLEERGVDVNTLPREVFP